MPVDTSQLSGKNNIGGTPLSFMWKWPSDSVTLATQNVTGFLHP